MIAYVFRKLISVLFFCCSDMHALPSSPNQSIEQLTLCAVKNDVKKNSSLKKREENNMQQPIPIWYAPTTTTTQKKKEKKN